MSTAGGGPNHGTFPMVKLKVEAELDLALIIAIISLIIELLR